MLAGALRRRGCAHQVLPGDRGGRPLCVEGAVGVPAGPWDEEGRSPAPVPWSRLGWVAGPTAVAMVAWMVFQQVQLENALAFAQAQTAQRLHAAGP